MEYERIHKTQNGIISPSKLRMKLMGPHNGRTKESSPRTSPSKTEEIDFAMNGLLTASSGESDDGGNPSHASRTVHPDNLDYDSNASSSSFEFHKERAAQSQMPLTRSLSRPMASKWNDAEKWIMSKPNPQMQQGKKLNNRVRNSEEFRLPLPPMALDTTEEESEGVLGVRSVCMRDMGTEMTPATSVEPSRSATPAGAGTPLRSPADSIPTTPRKATEPACAVSCRKLSEEEQKQKTRREIVALGKQLGKLSIAEWASKGEDNPKPNFFEGLKSAPDCAELGRIERENLAARWEEAEKSKCSARHKREEMKILAWEAKQKAIMEAELRKIEAQVEKLHFQAQAKMVKKISLARQRSEEKRAGAEARRKLDEEKAAAKAESIRQTGRIPSSRDYLCCGLR